MNNKALVLPEKISYEQLPSMVRERIDGKIGELRMADSTELLTYGMETQAKVSSLVDAIESQVGRLIEDNIMYDRYIELLVENINSISETIIALEMYIEEVKNRKNNGEALEEKEEYLFCLLEELISKK